MQPHVLSLLEFLDQNQNRSVIDADTHITNTVRYPHRQTPHYYHGRSLSAEDLISEMDRANVTLANTWQNPAATTYTEDPLFNYEALLEANAYVWRSAKAYPRRLIASGWTDPKACGVDNARRIVDQCIHKFDFLIVKLNPAQNRYPIDSPEVIAVVDHIVAAGGIPAFHFGADTPFTPASGLETIALRHPTTKILAVHMGGGGASYLEAEDQYHASRELGLRCKNIHYVLSALRDTHIESNLKAHYPHDSHRVFCASDAPYGRISWNFGGFRAMFDTLPFDQQTIQGHLGSFFAQFILDGYRNRM
ncbi:MAG: hypothetical protein FJW36_06520 [Acidobacteria bacterium]|nr:hypothetical protein [Acidobacteriota bacterium]